jgi:antitoxin (DNA-binding transcriptional repressor) of toxin-antitoxin stability system
MSDEYSLYDAKANFSNVRETGNSVIVTVHGEPAVEIRALQDLPVDIEARIAELTARGVIRPARASVREYTWKPRARKRAGGLDRFLKERGDD